MNKGFLRLVGWTTITLGLYLVYKGDGFQTNTTVDRSEVIDAVFTVVDD